MAFTLEDWYFTVQDNNPSTERYSTLAKDYVSTSAQVYTDWLAADSENLPTSYPTEAELFNYLSVQYPAGLPAVEESLALTTQESYAQAGVNLIINSDFSINQRNFAGGSLTADTYGFDRWKAREQSTTSVSRAADGTVTLNDDGKLVQVIEAAEFGPSFTNQEFTVAMLDPSEDFEISFSNHPDDDGKTTATISAGNGLQTVTFTASGLDSGGDMMVSVTQSSGGNASFKEILLAKGSETPVRSQRTKSEELRRCQRYYVASLNVSGNGHANTAATLRARGTGYFPVEMRIAPTVSLNSEPSGNDALGLDDTATDTLQGEDTTTRSTTFSFKSAGTGSMSWTADVELDAEF